MPEFSYDQNKDPRWRTYRSTRSGVCMALSTHFVIKALKGEDFLAWLAPPTSRLVLGAARQQVVQDVRYIYDVHEKLKAAAQAGGYLRQEVDFLKGLITFEGGRQVAELSMVSAKGPPFQLLQMGREIWPLLSGGHAVYCGWWSASIMGAHAIAFAPGAGQTYRFFEPGSGESNHADHAGLMRKLIETHFSNYGISTVDQYLLMAFRMG